MSASLHHFQHSVFWWHSRSFLKIRLSAQWHQPRFRSPLLPPQLISSLFIVSVNRPFISQIYLVIRLLSLATAFISPHFEWPPVFWDTHHVYFRSVSGDSMVWSVRYYFLPSLAAAHFFNCSMMFYSKHIFHEISSMWVLKVPVSMWVLRFSLPRWGVHLWTSQRLVLIEFIPAADTSSCF